MSFEMQTELDRETESAQPQFDELLDFAVDAMLSDQASFDVCYEQLLSQHSTEPSQSQALGLWVVNEAMTEEIEIDEPLRQELESNERLTLPLNPGIQLKIEALGQAILDEAFNCLGSDAMNQVHLFNQAKTDKDKNKVIGWLIDRIYDIGKPFEGELEEVPATSNEAN